MTNRRHEHHALRYDALVKRRLLTIILFLLAGAMVNVSIAWYFCVYISQQTNTLQAPNARDARVWRSLFGTGVTQPDTRWEYRSATTTLYTLGMVDDSQGPDALDRQKLSLTVFEAGWPLRTVSTAMKSGDADWFPYIAARNMPFVADNHPRVLPVKPLWRGFAANTILYAVILWMMWMLLAVLFSTRRHRRMQRGECPTCAYPVGKSPVCTECGSMIARG